MASDGHVETPERAGHLGERGAAARATSAPSGSQPARPSALLPPPAAQRRLRGNKVLRAGDSAAAAAAAAARGLCSALPATLTPYFPSVCARVCECVHVFLQRAFYI